MASWYTLTGRSKKKIAGSQVYVEILPAWRKESCWSSSQRTSNTIGTKGGQKNYDNDAYDDDNYDDDDDDDDDADDNDDDDNDD